MTEANKIEQIMADAMARARRQVTPSGPTLAPMPKQQVEGYIHAARQVLAALDAAGLAVVAVHATADQVMQAPSNVHQDDCCRVYAQMVAAFNPTTFKPEPTE